jgi:predicted MFS family arabinose efflux permease
MGAGISIGSATAGQIVDACGTRVCFGCAACCASAAVLAGYTVRRRLRPPVS